MPRGIPKNKTVAPADGVPKRRGRPPKNPAAVAVAPAEPKKRGPYKKRGISAESLVGVGAPTPAATPSDLIARITAVRATVDTLARIDSDAAKEEVLHQIHVLAQLTDRLNGINTASAAEEEKPEYDGPQNIEPASMDHDQLGVVASSITPTTFPTAPAPFTPPPFPPVA